jgi:HK97 gp10 family phage protein
MEIGASLIAQLERIGHIPTVNAMKAGGQVFYDEMQNLTPVDTGALKESEAVIVDNNDVRLFAGTDHALPVEFGTIYQSAQSFMRASLDTKKDEALRVIANVTQSEIKKAVNG